MKTVEKITPLGKFPTEVLLMNFRKQRHCSTKLPWDIERHFNYRTNEWEYWEAVYGPFEIDGIMYEDMPIAYTKVAYNKKTREKINRLYTATTTRFYHSDKVKIQFDGMLWEGPIDELKKELDARPHISLRGSKEFRRWKIKYKKSIS